MFCINCGKELPPKAKFCPNCGTPVATVDQILTKMTEMTIGSENGHEWVDLGLSVKWATCNIGAKGPDDYGSRFAWGEVSPKESFHWKYYHFLSPPRSFIDPNDIKTRNPRTNKILSRNIDLMIKMEDSVPRYLTKYTGSDGICQLDISDDTARVNWGGKWRIPSESEFGELRSKCMWKWTNQGGTNGYNITGPNGNSIFLPVGLKFGMKHGHYWLSGLIEANPAYASAFEISDHAFMKIDWYRYWGNAVRPVTE